MRRSDRRVGVRQRQPSRRQKDRHQSQAEDDQHDDQHDDSSPKVQASVPDRLQPDLRNGRRQSQLELRQQVRHGEVQLRAQRE